MIKLNGINPVNRTKLLGRSALFFDFKGIIMPFTGVKNKRIIFTTCQESIR